jgi:hypothetical protein
MEVYIGVGMNNVPKIFDPGFSSPKGEYYLE